MASFERSRERKGRKKDFRGNPSRGGPRGRTSSRDNFRGKRDSDKDFKRSGRRELEFTKVMCASCGGKCEVPFKPTGNKPVYCSDCFKKEDKRSSSKPSNKDFDVINEKLDKIMEALGL
ncbi:hypothetical protein GOV09_05360 [Candidatus Woesearchaeota archaeon]|nr:hypothetical protein [Candidatus Woesearchaeota archaeon]